MNKKHVTVGAMLSICGIAILAFASDKDVCSDSSTFYSQAKKLNSWSEYHKIMVKCTVNGFKGSDSNPFSAFSDTEMNNLFGCVFQLTNDQLQTKCTYAKFVSYEGNSSGEYRKDLLLQDPCALAAATSIVAGQSYMQICIDKLKLRK